jgi:hypothetical protein
LYSPIKAFEKIVKKPDIKGPLLVLGLIIILTTGLQYVSSSKIFDEEPMINRDEWTESTAWISQWTSNGELTRDADKNASVYVGNYSIASSVANGTYIWMNLTGIESFNCSQNTGYERLSFWIKWKYENEIFESPNATLKLFSNNGDHYFKLDFGNKLSNSSDEWTSVKVDLGLESEDRERWERVGSPDWENVMEVEFALAWSVPASLTINIDDLYFAKFVPLSKYFLAGWFSSVMMSALRFFIHWGVFGGILLLVIKMFGEKVGSWKQLFVAVGYLFSVRIVYLLVTVALTPTLPEVRWEDLSRLWYPTIPYQTILYTSLLTDIWMAGLCTIAVRFFYTFTWKKAVGIAVLTALLNFTLRPLIPI